MHPCEKTEKYFGELRMECVPWRSTKIKKQARRGSMSSCGASFLPIFLVVSPVPKTQPKPRGQLENSKYTRTMLWRFCRQHFACLKTMDYNKWLWALLVSLFLPLPFSLASERGCMTLHGKTKNHKVSYWWRFFAGSWFPKNSRQKEFILEPLFLPPLFSLL
jgi:hypothetical protein